MLQIGDLVMLKDGSSKLPSIISDIVENMAKVQNGIRAYFIELTALRLATEREITQIRKVIR